MSTIISENTLLSHHHEAEMMDYGLLSINSSYENQMTAGSRGIQYSAVARKPKPNERTSKQRTLRRLTGFLVEMRGGDARVAFVDDGKTIPYDLPAETLRKSGIKIPNQPFQMDEVEIETDTGLVIGYHFQAIAKPEDAFIETLDFSPELKRKRDLILNECAKAKS